MRKSSAGLLTGLGLAGAMATACTSQVNPPTTVALVSHDGMAMQAPASGKITTAEGAWNFGVTANAGGDYPLLLNGLSRFRSPTAISTPSPSRGDTTGSVSTALGSISVRPPR